MDNLKSRAKEINRYMKLTKRDLAIMLVDAYFCINVLAGKKKFVKGKYPITYKKAKH